MKIPRVSGYIGVITLFLAASLQVQAQKAVIRVIDSETSEPCMYANVVLTDFNDNYLTAGATDQDGRIEFNLDRGAKLCITSVGYQTLLDTLRPGENRIIRLQTDFVNMEAVVITGQYEPKRVDESIYKIDVVDARILLERGVNNLAEALSNETSIRLTVDPSLGTSIEMQGMGGENIKYLIDGIPIVGRVGGDIDLSQINMENIDHIEIVKGPMSVQYGTSAIAGVVNIITKKNSYFRNMIKGNTYLDTKGNYNFGFYGSVIRGKHTVTLSGNRDLFQGVDIDLNVDTADVDGHDRYMEFKPKLVYNADAEYVYRKENFQLSVKSQLMNSLIKNYANYVEKVVLAYDNDFHTTRSLNSLTISDRISESLAYNVVGAYTYFTRTTDYITSDLYLLTKELTKQTTTSFNNIMTRGSFTYAPPDWKISFMTGWDVNYDNGSGERIEEGAEMGDYAVFLSSMYNPVKSLSLQPGIRFIYNSIYGAPLIPSMNLQWKIINNLGFRISYARGFRAPSLKELYLDFKDSNHDLSGNKDLKAETTNSYNASFDFTVTPGNSRLKIEPSVFYNNGKDAITLIVTDVQSNSATNVNLGGRRTLGGEINASFRHISGLSVGGGFSRIGETFDSEGTGDYVEMVYYNNFSVNSKFSFKKFRAVLMANLKYYGETPALASIPEENGGGYYRVYTDPYGDLEVTFTKTLWKNRITLVAGAKNLLDNYEKRTWGYRDFGQDTYQPEYTGPMNYGRTYFLKMNLMFIK